MGKPFFVVCFILFAVSKAQLYPTFRCPNGWTHFPWDDTCSALWPKEQFAGFDHDPTAADVLARPLNFNRAQEMCEAQDAALPLIRDLPTQLEFYKDLIGRTSGRSFWLNVWSDPSAKVFDSTTGTFWLTSNQRNVGFVFDWDTQRSMPRSFDRCVAMHMRGDSLLVQGGNEKMIGTDCGDVHHVICTKKRVPAGLGAVNEGEPRRLEFVWNTTDLNLTFYGSRIPSGTLLTLQSGDGIDSHVPKGAPTQCKRIRSVTGVSQPFPLQIIATSSNSTGANFSGSFCGEGSTTCDIATVTIPKDWPFVRGSTYSLCFYVADLFATPSASLLEYENNLLGNNMVIDVVQKYTSYQEDICEMRSKDIATFFGGYSDTGAPRRLLTPFDSSVEDSKDTLLSFKTLNPPKGYEFLN